MQNSKDTSALRRLLLAGCIAMSMSAPIVVAQSAPAIEASETVAEVEVDPGKFVESLVSELRGLAEAREEGREVDLKEVFARELDVDRMQRQLLSRASLKKATRDQFRVYRDLFPTYIATVYAESINELVSRTIKIDSFRERRADSGDYIVRSRLYDDKGKERARIDWRVMTSDGELRLVDVLVEGQSVNVERRAQFTSMVDRGGFDILLAHMREQLGQQAPS